MNVSFFLLILVLFALAFLTSWNKHVLVLMGVSTLLWASMAWSVNARVFQAQCSSQVRHRDHQSPEQTRQHADSR